MKGDCDAKHEQENEDAVMDAETTPLIKSKPYMMTGKQGVLDTHKLPFPLNHWAWFRNLELHFGYKLLVMLFASQHLMKGFSASLTGSAVQYLYGSYNVPGPRMQVFGGITSLPWAMKPIIGLVSDCMPINGYNKASYILIASVVGAASLAVIGFTPQTALSVEALVMCLFFTQAQLSTCDLLTEAKYAEKMQTSPAQGPNLMTFVWFGLQFGGLVATIISGPVLHHLGVKAPFLMALVPATFILFPVALNYMEETRQSPEQTREHRRRFFEQKEAGFLCVLMFCGTILLMVVGLVFKSIMLNAAVAIGVAVVMLVAFSVLLRPIIAKVNAFFLIQTALSFSIGGASFYFYTDTPKQYPEGPHFSMEFFTSVLGSVSSVMSLVGIFTYQRYMQNWSYRSLLLMTNLVLSVLSISDILILTRWNVRVGIPDYMMVVGGSIFQSVIAQWMWMPGVVILSQLCPKGMEATMYALLAGCHNLGNTIAANTGAAVLQWLECSPAGKDNETEQFKNLWLGAVLATVLPLVTLALLPYLIPNATQQDKLLAEDDRDATAGSLWKQWTAGSHEL
jgi:folate/biopterin transporter